MRIRITRLREGVELPSYATAGSVAFDLALADDLVIEAGATATGGTGLVIAVPTGHALLLFPRSSLFKKKGVPDVLLSGNHAEIKKWKKEKSLEATKKLRPDLLAKN